MKPIRLFIIIAAIAITSMIIYGFILFNTIADASERGQFGDMFGAITSLFTGLAFAGAILAVRLQSQELAMQREEMALQREEMAASRAELAASRVEYARAAEAQRDLVEKQMITARITGMSAIVQGRYAYAAAYGTSARSYAQAAVDAELLLQGMMREAGVEKMEIGDIIR